LKYWIINDNTEDMDESTALKIYFGIVTGLIAIVGYLIRGWINDRKTKEQKIEERVEKMGQDYGVCRQVRPNH